MAEKRSRRSRAELRDMIIEAGQDVLTDLEPTLGFEGLTYASVFRHLHEQRGEKVTIGSVHERIWKSQRAFQLDVLRHALDEALPATPTAAFDRAIEIISAADLSMPAGRKRALQSAIRLSSFHYRNPALTPSTELAYTMRFRLWELGPGHPEAAGFIETMTEIREQSTAQYAAVVRGLMKTIGIRVRPDAGDPDCVIHETAVLGNATSVGLITDPLQQSQRSRTMATGPNGEDEEWYPDAVALWTYVRSMFELDGDGLTDEERRL